MARNRNGGGKYKNLLEAGADFLRNQNNEAGSGNSEAITPANTKSPGLPASISLPELDRGGAREAPALNAPAFTPVDTIEVEESDILSEVSAVASDLLSGELPDAVVSQIEKQSAELGLSTGVFGEAQEFSTAQALGLESMKLVEAGISAGLNVGQLETQKNVAEADLSARIAETNASIGLSYATLEEDMRQWDDKLALSLVEAKTSIEQLTLAGLELVSINQRHTQSLVNDIIINNSKKPIEGGEQAIQDLLAFAEITDRAILKTMGII